MSQGKRRSKEHKGCVTVVSLIQVAFYQEVLLGSHGIRYPAVARNSAVTPSWYVSMGHLQQLSTKRHYMAFFWVETGKAADGALVSS